MRAQSVTKVADFHIPNHDFQTVEGAMENLRLHLPAVPTTLGTIRCYALQLASPIGNDDRPTVPTQTMKQNNQLAHTCAMHAHGQRPDMTWMTVDDRPFGFRLAGLFLSLFLSVHLRRRRPSFAWVDPCRGPFGSMHVCRPGA